MRRSFPLVLLVLLAGCGGPAPLRTPEPDQLGTFAYEASFEVHHEQSRGTNRRERLEIRGMIEVERDTIRVEAQHGLCHPLIRPNVARFVFTCDEFTLSFDRRFPTMNPHFGAAVPVTRLMRGDCAEWRTSAGGTRTCIRYEYHEVPGTQQVSGVLRLRPLRAAGAP